ncbi:MAG: hypothetical protein RR123_01030 [Clostridia bacterium]
MQDLLYVIGEILFTEIKFICDISYPNSVEDNCSLILKLENGKDYKLTISEKELQNI